MNKLIWSLGILVVLSLGLLTTAYGMQGTEGEAYSRYRATYVTACGFSPTVLQAAGQVCEVSPGDLARIDKAYEAYVDSIDEGGLSFELASWGVYILGSFVFFIWLYKAVKAYQESDMPMDISPWGAIGRFFIPVMSLWRVPQILYEISQGTQVLVILLWWTGMIVLTIWARAAIDMPLSLAYLICEGVVGLLFLIMVKNANVVVSSLREREAESASDREQWRRLLRGSS